MKYCRQKALCVRHTHWIDSHYFGHLMLYILLPSGPSQGLWLGRPWPCDHLQWHHLHQPEPEWSRIWEQHLPGDHFGVPPTAGSGHQHHCHWQGWGQYTNSTLPFLLLTWLVVNDRDRVSPLHVSVAHWVVLNDKDWVSTFYVNVAHWLGWMTRIRSVNYNYVNVAHWLGWMTRMGSVHCLLPLFTD